MRSPEVPGTPVGASLIRRRMPLLLLGMVSLVAGLWAGLLLLGIRLPEPKGGFAANHGIFFVLGFLGTVIGLERAVALGVALRGSRGWPWIGPVSAGAGSLWLILGLPTVVGKALFVVGGLTLVAVFVAVNRIHRDWHNLVMGLGAAGWLAGAVVWLAGGDTLKATLTVIPWLVTFLVLTIVGERLELSRMAKPPARAIHLLLVLVAVFLAGVVLNTFGFDDAGVRIAGAGLIGQALWLARFDVARRTIRIPGPTRYMAVALTVGYFWLAVAGVVWLLAGPLAGFGFSYDAMIHAIFVGFVFSMIFAHAPVIVPAVLGVPLPFRMSFYGPLALLHIGLAVRLCGDAANSVVAWRIGGVLNEIAILAFIALAASSAVRARRKGGESGASVRDTGPAAGVPGRFPRIKA